MSIARTRSALYRTASFLGDVQAVRKGPRATGRRVVRKSAWRGIARLMRSLLP